MLHQSLSLAQTQRLQMVLAPQLRQSLEMLHVPILELRAMIREEIEQNPTIEETPTETATVEIEPGSDGEEESSQDKELEFAEEFEVLARLDDEWRDYFFQDVDNRHYSPADDKKRQFLMDSISQPESLQEHLLGQLHLSDMNKEDANFAELIIGSINEDGYLASSITELAESTNSSEEHLNDILMVIQEFHPTGIGAVDLRDCLLLQLERLGKADTLAGDVVRDYLGKLGAHKYQDIARALKVSVDDIMQANKFISSLNPKPGRAFSADVASYVLPEVFVKKEKGKYEVVLNDTQLPHLRISRHYRKLMKNKKTTSEVKSYIRDKIRASAFLIKSIEQRQGTIFKIATEIVKVQTPFLDNGIAQLKPLVMSTVADAVGVHETTVSRAVSGKYMKTPVGVFEMKYFFTPGLKTNNGSDISNAAVKELINKMVEKEDPAKPLSDNAIMKNLKEQGISIARRTIAKYRLLLRIPPSHMRKMY